MKINELDRTRLSEILLNIPKSAMLMNHDSIKETAEGYIVPSENTLEVEFIRDLFLLTTDEIIEKWYGGQEAAANLLF